MVALFERRGSKGVWTGGKCAVSAKQMQDVIDVLDTDTPAWFRTILNVNYGHHGFLDYGQTKQILALLHARAQKAQPAAGSQGSPGDQDAGKGVGAAPQDKAQDGALGGPAVTENVEVIRDWLEGQVKLHQRQLKDALVHHPHSRKDYERNATVEAYSAAMIKLAGVLLDSLACLTPDGWRLKSGADCPWCGERNEVVFTVKIDGDHEGLADVDTLETCTACGRGFQAQLVSYLAVNQAEGCE